MADEDPSSSPEEKQRIKTDIENLPDALDADRGPPSAEAQRVIDEYVDRIIAIRYEGDPNRYAVSFLSQLDSILDAGDVPTIKSAKQILVSLQGKVGNPRIQRALDEIAATLQPSQPANSQVDENPAGGKRRRTRRRKTKVRRTRSRRRGRSTRHRAVR